MSEFIEIPASKRSMSFKKPVCGVGINDTTYMTMTYINKKRMSCPYYAAWNSMITRCYSVRMRRKFPTYSDCTVCDEWLLFSNFKSWMKSQEWKGNDIDKDILKPKNRIYSPEFCRFVPKSLNMQLVKSYAAKGDFPHGVSLHKASGKFQAQISVDGRTVYLGLFSTPLGAGKAYKNKKVKILLALSHQQSDPAIANGLRLHAEAYLRDS